MSNLYWLSKAQMELRRRSERPLSRVCGRPASPPSSRSPHRMQEPQAMLHRA